MVFDIGTALSEGLDRATERNAIVLLVLFVAIGLVNAVATQSIQLATFEQLATLLREQGETELAAQFEAAFSALPLALLPAGVAYAVTFVGFVLGEAVLVIADRTFVSDETERLHEPGRNLLGAIANSVVASLVIGVLLVVGTVLLVLPALAVAVLFFFTRQEIAVEDESFIDALTGSVGLTKGHRLELFALAFVLLAIGLVVNLLAGFVPGVAGTLLSVVASAAVGVYASAAVASAYRQLRAEREGNDDAFDTDDKWDDPTGVEI